MLQNYTPINFDRSKKGSEINIHFGRVGGGEAFTVCIATKLPLILPLVALFATSILYIIIIEFTL